MNYRIKEVCDERDIKVNSIADKVGISLPALYNIVNGKMSPKIETLEKIASALEVEIWELFTKSQSKDELTALIDHKGEFYKASTIIELEKIISTIKEKQQKIWLYQNK